MRILAIADVIAPQLYTAHVPERFHQVDLVLCCGDLPFDYIEFIVTQLGKPTFHVPGNHAPAGDGILGHDGQYRKDPEGSTNIDGRIITFRGLRIGGLGGSVRYNNEANHYSQGEMHRRVWRMTPRLAYNQRRYGRGLDILITHASPRGIHDQADPAHRGFDAFVPLMRRYRPRYLIHGHIHLYRGETQCTQFEDTTVLNAYGFQIIDLNDNDQ